MIIIKFDTNAPVLNSAIRQDTFRITNGIPEVGYWCMDSTFNEHKLVTGDFIVINGDVKVFRNYVTDVATRRFIKRAIGQNVVEDLLESMDAQNLTDAQEDDLINRIQLVLIMLSGGYIRGALTRATGLTVAGQLTNGRKNFLVNRITAAVALL